MDVMRRTLNDLDEERAVEDVPLDEVEVRVLGKARPSKRVPVEVVERDDLVLVHEPPRKRRADEARPTRDDDPLAAQGHAASLVRLQRMLPRSCRAKSKPGQDAGKSHIGDL